MTDNLSALSKLHATAASIVPALYTAADVVRPLVIDTSHWTGVVDWQKAKAEGIHGAIIKFTDGKTVSKYAEENYKGARDAGLPVGGYHWLYRSANISVGGQARYYLDFLKDHPCDIRPTVDYEWTKYGGAQSNPTIDDLYGFVVPFEDGYGKQPMIYTAPGYWNDPKYNNSKATVWARYPLWVAQYRVQTPQPLAPWYDKYTLWQFTPNGDGVKYGSNPLFSRSADLSYFNGTLGEFYAWLDTSTPVPPENPPQPVPEPPAAIYATNLTIHYSDNSTKEVEL